MQTLTNVVNLKVFKALREILYYKYTVNFYSADDFVNRLGMTQLRADKWVAIFRRYDG